VVGELVVLAADVHVGIAAHPKFALGDGDHVVRRLGRAGTLDTKLGGLAIPVPRRARVAVAVAVAIAIAIAIAVPVAIAVAVAIAVPVAIAIAVAIAVAVPVTAVEAGALLTGEPGVAQTTVQTLAARGPGLTLSRPRFRTRRPEAKAQRKTTKKA
jgi:hypothetical protein